MSKLNIFKKINYQRIKKLEILHSNNSHKKQIKVQVFYINITHSFKSISATILRQYLQVEEISNVRDCATTRDEVAVDVCA